MWSSPLPKAQVLVAVVTLAWSNIAYCSTNVSIPGSGFDVSHNVSAISNGNYTSNLPEDNRPHYDLVIAVLVKGGRSREALDEIDTVRGVYARYENETIFSTGSTPAEDWTFKMVYIVGNNGTDEYVPPSGLLVGDFFITHAREGWEHLGDKTKAMFALREHFSFRFLAKTDSDTFPCLNHIIHTIGQVASEDQPRVYAGKLIRCQPNPRTGRGHDPEFETATGGVLPCHPMYHQGGFYVLGERLVRFLHSNLDMLKVMKIEDAMVGLWLLGIDKVMVNMSAEQKCGCHKYLRESLPKYFYHRCKTKIQMATCMQKIGKC